MIFPLSTISFLYICSFSVQSCLCDGSCLILCNCCSLLNGATSCDIHHTLLYFSRVIPNRRLQPEAFRLYMELLNRHAFTLMSSVKGENDQM